jgi:hypothetical protein
MVSVCIEGPQSRNTDSPRVIVKQLTVKRLASGRYLNSTVAEAFSGMLIPLKAMGLNGNPLKAMALKGIPHRSPLQVALKAIPYWMMKMRMRMGPQWTALRSVDHMGTGLMKTLVPRDRNTRAWAQWFTMPKQFYQFHWLKQGTGLEV